PHPSLIMYFPSRMRRRACPPLFSIPCTRVLLLILKTLPDSTSESSAALLLFDIAAINSPTAFWSTPISTDSLPGKKSSEPAPATFWPFVPGLDEAGWVVPQVEVLPAPPRSERLKVNTRITAPATMTRPTIPKRRNCEVIGEVICECA